MLQLSDKELKALEKIMTRKGFSVDDSSKYVGYYIQMKLMGVMSFRILHSQGTWIKARDLFNEFDIPVDSLPKWTKDGDKLNGVKWYKDDVLKARRVWEFFAGIERRGNKDLDIFDFQPADS